MSIYKYHIVSAVLGLLALFFAFLNLSEFYTVRINGDGAYPFGALNENPWYYKSAETYSWYMLISGLIFLLASIVIMYFNIKKQRAYITASLLFLFLLMILEMISSKVQ